MGSFSECPIIRAVTDEQIKAEIARLVCNDFIKARAATLRHDILVEFENLNVLYEMEQRNLIRPSDDRKSYRPTLDTFLVLGDDDELYQLARAAFTRTIRALRQLYRTEGCGVHHEPQEFATNANKLNSDEIPHFLVALGLYLAAESGALQIMKMSDDHMTVERFQVAEQVIAMRDPEVWWAQRVQASREPIRAFGVPMEQLHAAPYEPTDGNEVATEPFDESVFWSLIHPKVAAEARPRFEAGHFADAVEWALKVVAENVRQRTGLKLDGSELMYRAFAPKSPYLEFEDQMPLTRDSMQQGYMQIFAGTMTGVRNPKVHGMVKLERKRCIHFLFLASLLAFKVDEAIDAHPTEPVQRPAPSPKPELASLHITVGSKGMSGEVRTVNVSAVIENISTVKRITEYSCTLSVPRSCLTFQSALYPGEIKSGVVGRRTFRRTEIDEGATKIVLPGGKLKVFSLDLGIDQLRLKGTWMEGDFEAALKDEVTLDAVVQGEKLHVRKPIGEIFEGMPGGPS